MRIAAVSRVETTVDYDRASAEFRLSTSRLQAWTMVSLSLLGIAALLLPIGLIAVDALSNPQVIHTLAEHPGSSVLLGGGMLVGLALLLFPLRSGIERLGGDTVVRMADGMVTAERRGILRSSSWQVPLAQFSGVTHHIRATLSGPRHEIILVHTDPSKDVLLHVAARPPKEGGDHYAHMLGLTEVQPRTLYSRRRPGPIVQTPADLQAQAA